MIFLGFSTYVEVLADICTQGTGVARRR